MEIKVPDEITKVLAERDRIVRNSALEEAAKVADHHMFAEGGQVAMDTAKNIADYIRQMKA